MLTSGSTNQNFALLGARSLFRVCAIGRKSECIRDAPPSIVLRYVQHLSLHSEAMNVPWHVWSSFRNSNIHGILCTGSVALFYWNWLYELLRTGVIRVTYLSIPLNFMTMRPGFNHYFKFAVEHISQAIVHLTINFLSSNRQCEEALNILQKTLVSIRVLEL